VREADKKKKENDLPGLACYGKISCIRGKGPSVPLSGFKEGKSELNIGQGN